MAQVFINVGGQANDGTGDSFRQAGTTINNNFTYFYGLESVQSHIGMAENVISSQLSNADIVLKPSGTGNVILGSGITFADNNIITNRSNDNLNIVPAGTGAVAIAGLKVSGNNISAFRTNDDINIVPPGTGAVSISGALSDATSLNLAGDGATVTGILDEDAMGSDSATKLATQQSIKAYVDSKFTALDLDFQGDSGGALSIDLDSETFTFEGSGGITADGASNTITVNLNSMSGLVSLGVGSLTFSGNDIVSSSNADINITPGGTGGVVIGDSFRVRDAHILGTRSNEDIYITPAGTGVISYGGIRFNENEILSLYSNSDIVFIPAGTGSVNVTNLTIDSNINLTDNTIQPTASNSDLQLTASGSGKVAFKSDVDIDGGTIDNTVIGAATPAAGTFTVLTSPILVTGGEGITITDDEITTSRSNDHLEIYANGSGYVYINAFRIPSSDGGTGQLLMTNASKELSWGESGIILGESDIQDGSGSIGFSTDTTVDTIIATGSHESITTSAATINKFDCTKYDSAWYLAIHRDDTHTEFETAKYSVCHNIKDGGSGDAFIGVSHLTRTSHTPIINLDARVVSNKVEIRGTGYDDGSTDNANSVTFYRIGLGDNDSTGWSDGNASTKINTDLDSAVETLDSWAHASYRGAKYYISVKGLAADSTTEVTNIECLVVHNGSDAFILPYNDISTGNQTQITLTADISGSDVRLRGAGNEPNLRVHMHRILLSDSESDASGTNVNVIGEVEVTNTGKTTIDTNSFRGTATPDMSSQKVISSFTKTDYDSVWYHMIQKDNAQGEWIMNKLSSQHGVTTDGSSVDAFVSDSSVLKTGAMNDITNFDVGLNGSTFELKATAVSDGSTTIDNAITYYGIGLGDNTPTATSGKISTHSGVTFGGNNETRVDTITATGTTTSILSTQRTLANFTTSAYDSAWFLGVSNDVTNSGFATFKYSVMHGTTSDGSTQDAFITSSSVTRTDISHNHLETDADISGSDVRLLGNGGRLDDSSKSNSNTMAYYRIGLGDSDSSGYTSDDGNADTDVVTVGGIQETTIDHVTATGTHATLSASGTTTCAEFTAGQYNGALFYVVNNDVANGSFETQKISIAHNLNDSFMTSSSIVSTDEGDQHPVYTTDMVTSDDSTSKIRLRSTDSDGSTVSANNTMAYYRIGIGDDDSTGYTGELGLVNDIMHIDIIDSAVTNLDTWTHASHCGAKYFINVKNQSTGETSNIEALVTHNNTDAFISTYNEHFSGNNSLITLTADISGTSVRLRGSATSGGSTKVIVNRIVAFGDSESDEATTDSTRKVIGNVITSSAATTFDTFQSSDTDAVHYVITGQGGTNENYICEASVVTDGTGVFVSHGPSITTKTGEIELLTISATISSGVVSVKAASTSGATTVQAYAVRLKAPESSTATVDSFAASSFRGAKYFISLNNLDSNEVSNVECLVVHNGTDAFINQYNEHFSGSASLINGDLTADISGGNVRLRCGVAQDNTRITFYKIILADAETDITGGTNVNVIGDVTVSSAATAIDTYVDTDIDGAHYVIIGYNASEGAASIQEANVITNGTTAFVSSGPYVSTKGTNQLDLTADHDGSSTVTLSAASTSGGSTKVNAYRIHLKAPTGQTDNLDTWAKGTYRGAKYYISAKETITGYTSNIECLVVHDGTTVYINDFNEHFSNVSLVTLTADISGSDVRVRCAGNIPDVKVKWYRILLGDGESDSTGTDTKVVGAVTVSSAATAIDTFVDTSYTGAHYVIVGYNSGEASASISEATVLTDGTNAHVAQGPEVSTKDSHHLTLTANHDGSSTVTLSAAASSGGSTTVNAFRIHMLRETGGSYTEIDTFDTGDYKGAHYIIVGKNAANESMIAELTAVADGSDAYITETPNISTHSTTTQLMDFTAVLDSGTLKLRAENTQENTNTTVNAYRVHLPRDAGNTSSLVTLDSWDKTVYRSAIYNMQIVDNTNGKYESFQCNVVHGAGADSSTQAYVSIFGRVSNIDFDGSTAIALATITARTNGNNVELRGEISTTDDHEVKFVRRVIKI